VQKFTLLIIVFVLSALPGPAMAQEDSESVAEEAEQDELDSQPEVEAAEEEPEEEIVVDDEFYQDADDEDFRPSEDIPADQSIAFPTDI
jgi:hypothetical protein